MSRLAAEADIEPGLYRLPEDPIGEKVLIPGFRAATSVRGAFGWFTAGWIARLSPGLANYLNRGEVEPITFTVAPVLYPKEREAIEAAHAMTADEACRRVAHVFTDGRVDAGALGRHALDCLAWMVATGQLRLRVAVPTPRCNYHPKIWLFDDGEHRVLVRGSANATGRGIDGAVEHMDVDVSWSTHGPSRIVAATSMLEDWWRGHSLGIDRVVDMPDAIREGIVATAPSSAPSSSDYRKAQLTDSPASPAEVLRARLAATRPRADRARLRIPAGLEWRTGAYSHQGEAVAAWEAAGERGTVAMATGAGKTVTALVCATRAQDRLRGSPFLVVVSAPSVPLLGQWKKEIRDFGLEAVTPTTAADSNVALTNLFRSLGAGGTSVVVVTNNLLCNPVFQRTVATCIETSARRISSILIGDEAHTLGAKGFVANKPEFFERRLALSATPERQYDPDGTEEIFEFFGPPVYRFGLERAIGFCLTPYAYHVHAGVLERDELDTFRDLTNKIGRLARLVDNGDDNTGLTSLLIRRRRIIETAEAKLPLLRAVLHRRGPRTLEHALVYASAKNPAQFEGIAEILNELEIRWAPVTQETTRNTRLLNDTLRDFAAGGYQVLLAKKVLDEGIDIPSIREAFLVASSTVEREWVQRRGRILRLHPEKPYAVLHDFLALPPTSLVRRTHQSDTDLRRIVQGELSRALAFAAHADNFSDVSGTLTQLEGIKTAYWPSPAAEYSAILESAGDHLIAPSTPRGTPW
ncbi:MAG: DEAD/DEAH box helicase family protein [bacterium]|nr:DEAD/DEAH box helicase family protein [bacterium]